MLHVITAAKQLMTVSIFGLRQMYAELLVFVNSLCNQMADFWSFASKGTQGNIQCP